MILDRTHNPTPLPLVLNQTPLPLVLNQTHPLFPRTPPTHHPTHHPMILDLNYLPFDLPLLFHFDLPLLFHFDLPLIFLFAQHVFFFGLQMLPWLQTLKPFVLFYPHLYHCLHFFLVYPAASHRLCLKLFLLFLPLLLNLHSVAINFLRNYDHP